MSQLNDRYPRALFINEFFTDGDNEFSADEASVYATADGHFIGVCTDPDEGDAMMTLPCAEKAYVALGMAIQKAKEFRERSDRMNVGGAA